MKESDKSFVRIFGESGVPQNKPKNRPLIKTITKDGSDRLLSNQKENVSDFEKHFSERYYQRVQ